MHAPHATGHRCHVFHLGLSYREVLVLESLFRLHGDLHHHYAFGPSSDDAPADILFVDGDDPATLAEWRVFATRHPAARAVFVCTRADDHPDALALSRPLNFRKLDEVRYALRCATPADVARQEDGGLRVLVVDDSATARDLLHAHLSEVAGSNRVAMQVDFAHSGQDALDKAQDHHYDLVFLDVVMPGVDGYEVCRRLKQARPTRIAMLSSCQSAADYDRGHAAGCDHYLAKPAPPALLNTVVRLTAMKKAMPAW